MSKFLILSSLTFSTLNLFAQNQSLALDTGSSLRLNVAQTLMGSEIVKTGQAQVLLCFSNEDFKANVDLSLLRATDRLKITDPAAVIDSPHELCVDPNKVVHSRKEVEELR
ncbi:MAG: hypothetical protein ACK5V3_05315, partial [Bdellovibrionales bacterium]